LPPCHVPEDVFPRLQQLRPCLRPSIRQFQSGRFGVAEVRFGHGDGQVWRCRGWLRNWTGGWRGGRQCRCGVRCYLRLVVCRSALRVEGVAGEFDTRRFVSVRVCMEIISIRFQRDLLQPRNTRNLPCERPVLRDAPRAQYLGQLPSPCPGQLRHVRQEPRGLLPSDLRPLVHGHLGLQDGRLLVFHPFIALGLWFPCLLLTLALDIRCGRRWKLALRVCADRRFAVGLEVLIRVFRFVRWARLVCGSTGPVPPFPRAG
jgi:hypothetical protein